MATEANPPDSGEVPSIIVLLHTLPPGSHGVRAQDAVFRQYNSCVDFTFQESQACGNARRLKRLNAIFERAADRHSGGIREDKLLRILPSGTAPKYGIDPAAIKRRLQERRDLLQQLEEAEMSSSEDDGNKKRSKRKKKKKKKSRKRGCEASAQVPNVPVISRGTFLAMFANESSTFINTMGQNEKADRERKTMRSKSNGTGTNGSSVKRRETTTATGNEKPESLLSSENPAPTAKGLSPTSSGSGKTPQVSRKKKSGRSNRGKKDGEQGNQSRQERKKQRKVRNGRKEDGRSSRGTISSSSRSKSRTRPKSRSTIPSDGLVDRGPHSNEDDLQRDDLSPDATEGFGATEQSRRQQLVENIEPPSSTGKRGMRRNSIDFPSSEEDSTNNELFDLSAIATSRTFPANLPSEAEGHSADEAGGRSSAKYGYHGKDDKSRSSRKPIREKELSREERKALRKEKKRAKEEARRIEVSRELKLVEQKKKALEEEQARMLKEAHDTERNMEECVFLSSVASVLKSFLPSVGKNGAVVGVAPEGQADNFSERRYTGIVPHIEEEKLQNYPPSSFGHFNSVQTLSLPQGGLPVPRDGNRAGSFSSHSTGESLIGEHMLHGINTPASHYWKGTGNGSRLSVGNTSALCSSNKETSTGSQMSSFR